ncbi:hypothetical protein F5X68DRAFT_239255 [Plectosphaerella plurivora]|uniref:Uncharacterized protein n=1 Tax=Plectosphaerella plurivora TaxID=936078 RepID=A0A9P8VDI9_9PEZI|nr:hypothetical protein F5X68DRAFT_239255 [Plectosphaerella plurivora]
MGHIKDLARQFLAMLSRTTNVKEKPELKNNKADCYTRCHGLEPQLQTGPQPKSTKTVQNRWNFRPGAEFPWRFEQLVEEEENWRGTWVLEVKDMQAMDSGTVRVPRTDGNGRGGRYD